jgi:hypothetical protein
MALTLFQNADILHLVIDFLDPISLHRLSRTNSLIREYIDFRQGSIFKRIAVREYNVQCVSPDNAKESPRQIYIEHVLCDVLGDLEMFLSFVHCSWERVSALAQNIKRVFLWGDRLRLRNAIDPFLRRIYNRVFFYDNSAPKVLKSVSSLLIKYGASFTTDSLVYAVDIQDMQSIKAMVRRRPDIVHECVVDNLPIVWYLTQALALYRAFNLRRNRPRLRFIRKVISFLIKQGAKTSIEGHTGEQKTLKAFFDQELATFQNQLLFFRCNIEGEKSGPK